MPMLDLDDPKILASYSTIPDIFPPEFFESLKSIDIITESISEPLRLINESIGQMLATQVKLVNFAEIFKPYYPPAKIIDDEFINDPIPLLPAPAKPRLGIHMTGVKTFKFRRKIIKGLSQKNAAGRLMAFLMENKDLFASDQDIRKLLNLEDNRSLGWVLRDLKNKFKANFLKISFERTENPRGYQISDIKYLQ